MSLANIVIASSQRVVVIGLDAADVDLIELWAQEGYLPVLSPLMQEGTWGRIETTTDLAHTSVGRGMMWYIISVCLHILAVTLWIGHMVFWVTAAGTITKRFLSAEAQQAVVEHRDEFGQIGWFALSILVLTGIFMLYHHGVTFEHMTSSPFGRLLSMKLCLVALMIGLQHYVGPKRPILGWVNLFVALGVIGLSTSLVR